MRKGYKAFPLLLCLWCCGCAQNSAPVQPTEKLSLYDYEQTPFNLGINPEDMPKAELTYKPLNYDIPYGMWFTAMDYADILMTKTEEEFTAEIERRFENAADLGINTVYVQVRAFGDAYYNSELFSRGLYSPSGMDFDPLEIMTEKAHSLSLSIHAWINPLRCQSEVQMEAMDEKYTLKKWYMENKGTYMSLVNGRYWLCPAYEEVRKLAAEGAAEIAENYNVDGIHIDDYFYPTSDEGFDSDAFELSSTDSLRDFREEQCSLLVQEMYNAVKEVNPNVLFGISPQGTMKGNESQYADVKRWCSEEGFCDYIVPQIYFGFENETAPFVSMVKLWQDMTSLSKVKLVTGICTYKAGQEDIYAGTGKYEWTESDSIISREAEYVTGLNMGCAFYSYKSTFLPSSQMETSLQNERERLKNILKK